MTKEERLGDAVREWMSAKAAIVRAFSPETYTRLAKAEAALHAAVQDMESGEG